MCGDEAVAIRFEDEPVCAGPLGLVEQFSCAGQSLFQTEQYDVNVARLELEPRGKAARRNHAMPSASTAARSSGLPKLLTAALGWILRTIPLRAVPGPTSI